MQPPDLVERPSRTAFGKLMIEALESQGRVVHSSGAGGLFVKASQPLRLHRLELAFYPVHSMLGPLLPRLQVNRSSFGIPDSLLRKWRIPNHNALQRDVSLEITFLPTEAESISTWITTLIETLEDDTTEDWSRGFPFEIHKTSSTNLWSDGAKKYANECARANGSLNPRKVS